MKRLYGYDVLLIAILGIIFGHEATSTGVINFTAGWALLGLLLYLVKAVYVVISNHPEAFE